MNVRNLLALMAHNPALKFTIYDDNAEIITFEAAGYEAINDTVANRELDKITIAEERNYIKLYLKAVPEVEPEPTPDEVPTDEDNP